MKKRLKLCDCSYSPHHNHTCTNETSRLVPRLTETQTYRDDTRCHLCVLCYGALNFYLLALLIYMGSYAGIAFTSTLM